MSIDTIDELKKELALLKKNNEWLMKQLENCEIENNMLPYSPVVTLKINVALDNTNVPIEIMNAIQMKFYQKAEDKYES